MNKTLLSILAVGLVALFLGAGVSAVSVNGQVDLSNDMRIVEKVPAVLPEMKDIKTPAPVLVKVKDATAVKADVRPISPQALDASRLAVVKKIQSEKQEKPQSFDKFKGAVVHVKAAIVKDKEEGNGNSSFQGWSIQRIVNATKMTDEQKKLLLSAYTGSRIDALQDQWHRSNFLMWNADKAFVAIGKMTSVQTGSTMSFFARGYNSQEQHRFYFFGSNGLLAGVQNGHVFWGTYSEKTGTLNFDDGTSMNVQFMMYSNQ